MCDGASDGRHEAVIRVHGHGRRKSPTRGLRCWRRRSSAGPQDFAKTPVWVTAEEHRYVRDGGVISGLARGIAGVHYEEYEFDGGPYLGFPKSHDVYGDGSIVIVAAAGLTPGSVIVFLALPDGTRYAHVGDLAWQREGITEREERSWVPRALGDFDPRAGAREPVAYSRDPRSYQDIVLMPAGSPRYPSCRPGRTGPS
jgi:N-acyl homoserine lactone hydrolase